MINQSHSIDEYYFTLVFSISDEGRGREKVSFDNEIISEVFLSGKKQLIPLFPQVYVTFPHGPVSENQINFVQIAVTEIQRKLSTKVLRD